MKRIGVTGGIGSGKSTFCQFLEERGAKLFNADKEATVVMETDSETISQLKRLLGAKAYLQDGSLDRAWISNKAFSDSEILGKIGEIVHPRVHARFDNMAREAERQGFSAIVREAAVLPDSSSRESLDIVIGVLAERLVRIERVIKRSGLSQAQIEARIQAQPSDEEYTQACDLIIWNNGSLASLEKEAGVVWNSLFPI